MHMGGIGGIAEVGGRELAMDDFGFRGTLVARCVIIILVGLITSRPSILGTHRQIAPRHFLIILSLVRQIKRNRKMSFKRFQHLY